MFSLRSKITQKVLGNFFVHEEESFYVNELSRQLDLDSGNLTRKLLEMEKTGLLKSEPKGNLKYYSLNKDFPLLKEYRQIILKTVGLEAELKSKLSQVPGIKNIYLFGSYAANKMDNTSDIDLLVIGNHKPLDAQKACLTAQHTFRREINMVSLTPTEFNQKKKTDPFLKSILQKQKLVLL